jgi:hypothetical protein
LNAKLADEILHLPAVFALPGSIDQAIEAIDKLSIASVDLSIAGPITTFPA